MSNRVKPGARARAAEPVVDHGAALVRPGEYIAEDGADPDDPNRTVRRSRRDPAYVAWHRAGSITDAQREAADRYATQSERASGAAWRPERVGGGSSRGMLPAEWQLAAIRDIADVTEALGPLARVLWYVAVEGQGRDALRVTLGDRDPLPLARQALDAAAQHWRMD